MSVKTGNNGGRGGGGGGFSCFACLGKKQRPPHPPPPSSNAVVVEYGANNGNVPEDAKPITDDVIIKTVPPDDDVIDIEALNGNFDAGIENDEEEEEEEELDNVKGNRNRNNLDVKSTPSTVTNTTVSPSSISMAHLTSSTCSPQPTTQPLKGAFFVSFIVDARGGAMTGGRGSGLRLIIPQGALEQPVRVTCRYLKGGQSDRNLMYPPPLMDREALASRVIEMGPAGASFEAPVLIEVPHFASLRQGERELVVLRSDDGETWQEHTMAYYSSWASANQENEIYQDFIVNSQIGPAFEVLSTDRVVRISTKVFPHYFAILSRVKEEVRVMGQDGGKITVSHTPQLQVYFPPKALLKRIKVALQVQTVPPALISLIYPEKAGRSFRASPLVALDPRRRRFHCPVQVMVPLPKKAKKMTNRRIRLLCSLTGSVSRANWEDVTEATPLASKNEDCIIVFETKVSALFWVVAIDDDPVAPGGSEDPNMIMSRSEYEDISRFDDRDKIISRVATVLYEELVLPPYMARILVLYRPHAPHAWLDTLLIFCVTDDKADLAFDSKAPSFANSCSTLRSMKSAAGSEDWKLLLQTEEMELPASSILKFELDRCKGNLVVAQDCQFEYGYRQSLTFVPFQNNSCTLLVRAPITTKPKKNQLKVSKVISSIASGTVSGTENEPPTSESETTQSSVLCHLEIDLDSLSNPEEEDSRTAYTPGSIAKTSSTPQQQAVSPTETKSLPDLEPVPSAATRSVEETGNQEEVKSSQATSSDTPKEMEVTSLDAPKEPEAISRVTLKESVVISKGNQKESEMKSSLPQKEMDVTAPVIMKEFEVKSEITPDKSEAISLSNQKELEVSSSVTPKEFVTLNESEVSSEVTLKELVTAKESEVKSSVTPNEPEVKSSVTPNEPEVTSSITLKEFEVTSTVTPKEPEVTSSIFLTESEVISSVTPQELVTVQESEVTSSVTPQGLIIVKKSEVTSSVTPQELVTVKESEVTSLVTPQELVTVKESEVTSLVTNVVQRSESSNQDMNVEQLNASPPKVPKPPQTLNISNPATIAAAADNPLQDHERELAINHMGRL